MSSTKQRVVFVVGAGALGREVAQYLGDASMVCGGFLDDSPAIQGVEIDGFRVAGTTSGYQFQSLDGFVIAVGDPAVRRGLHRAAEKSVAPAVTVIHPTAHVARFATIGRGVIVGPFCYVGPGARLEDHCVLNTYASVGHDATVGRFSVLSPYAMLNGSAVLEEGVFLGSKASVLPGVRVGAGSKVSAGTVVTSDAPPAALVAGSPARFRVMFPRW